MSDTKPIPICICKDEKCHAIWHGSVYLDKARSMQTIKLPCGHDVGYVTFSAASIRRAFSAEKELTLLQAMRDQTEYDEHGQ